MYTAPYLPKWVSILLELAPCCSQVAGHHRASPSAALDKRFSIVVFNRINLSANYYIAFSKFHKYRHFSWWRALFRAKSML